MSENLEKRALDAETLEEIKTELEETKKIIKDKIIEKINEREELIEDLDGTVNLVFLRGGIFFSHLEKADDLKEDAKQFKKITQNIEEKEEVNAACFPSLTELWISARHSMSENWVKIKRNSLDFLCMTHNSYDINCILCNIIYK